MVIPVPVGADGAVTDGGIPLLSRVIDGGAAEILQIIGTMNAPRAR
ncbi:hypothetical protein ACFVZJ_10205 [Streptomyces sp. NPDC058322]